MRAITGKELMISQGEYINVMRAIKEKEAASAQGECNEDHEGGGTGVGPWGMQ